MSILSNQQIQFICNTVVDQVNDAFAKKLNCEKLPESEIDNWELIKRISNALIIASPEGINKEYSLAYIKESLQKVADELKAPQEPLDDASVSVGSKNYIDKISDDKDNIHAVATFNNKLLYSIRTLMQFNLHMKNIKAQLGDVMHIKARLKEFIAAAENLHIFAQMTYQFIDRFRYLDSDQFKKIGESIQEKIELITCGDFYTKLKEIQTATIEDFKFIYDQFVKLINKFADVYEYFVTKNLMIPAQVDWPTYDEMIQHPQISRIMLYLVMVLEYNQELLLRVYNNCIDVDNEDDDPCKEDGEDLKELESKIEDIDDCVDDLYHKFDRIKKIVDDLDDRVDDLEDEIDND